MCRKIHRSSGIDIHLDFYESKEEMWWNANEPKVIRMNFSRNEGGDEKFRLFRLSGEGLEERELPVIK